MSGNALDPEAAEVKRVVDIAIRQLQVDTARLARALRAVPTADADGVSNAAFAAIAAAYRNVLAAAKTIRALDTLHVSKALAMTVFSLQASGLEAYHRSLRAGASSAARQQDARASKYFKAAAMAFLELDRSLDCAYGCKGKP